MGNAKAYAEIPLMVGFSLSLWVNGRLKNKSQQRAK
jgi:hypothetical protein